MSMQAIQTDEGVVFGAWLFTFKGPPIYRGPKYLEIHFKRSDVTHENEYNDDELTEEQNEATRKIMRSLGR